MHRDQPRQGGLFEETSWTVVADLQGDGAARTAALEKLCRAYTVPLCVYARATGLSQEDAEDVVQDFLATAIRRDLFAKADQGRGKLRTFLLAGLQQQIIDWRRHQGALKRGGNSRTISLDTADESSSDLHPLDLQSPDELFARKWMQTLLDSASDQMRAKWVAAGRAELFEAFLPFLLESPEHAQKQTASSTLGITPGNFSVMLHRFRQEFSTTLRHRVSQTVRSPQDIDDELRDLGWQSIR